MSEEKMIIPAYVRIGVCKECGAHVYAPEGDGLPFMSSCPCTAGERKVVSAAEGAKRKPVREVGHRTDGKGKAA